MPLWGWCIIVTVAILTTSYIYFTTIYPEQSEAYIVQQRSQQHILENILETRN